MKQRFAAILGLMAVLCAQAAEPRGTVLDREITALAQTLQSRLPPLAIDGMCEIERQGNGWDFTFRVKAEGGNADEVRVIVRAVSAAKSELRVHGVHVESSLITSNRSANAALSKEWTDRVLKLVEAQP